MISAWSRSTGKMRRGAREALWAIPTYPRRARSVATGAAREAGSEVGNDHV